ncbi:MAG: ankyrin repeat domain-containing protein [Gammaproteobacteria bacterium]|nr:ankyrin repeat domain-containing protein [Gammaproteobacteria bacterium]
MPGTSTLPMDVDSAPLIMTHFPEAPALEDFLINHLLPYLIEHDLQSLANMARVSRAGYRMVNDRQVVTRLYQKYALETPSDLNYRAFTEAFNQIRFSLPPNNYFPFNGVLVQSNTFTNFINKTAHQKIMTLYAAAVARNHEEILRIANNITQMYRLQQKKYDETHQQKQREEQTENWIQRLFSRSQAMPIKSFFPILMITHENTPLSPLAILQKDPAAQEVLDAVFLALSKEPDYKITPLDRVQCRQFDRITDEQLDDCLFAALELKDDEALEVLLKKFDQESEPGDIDLVVQGLDHQSLLCSAVIHNYKRGITSLLEHGAKINALNAQMKQTALHYACMDRSFCSALIPYLISLGARANQPDSHGDTPLHFFARKKGKKKSAIIIRQLLEAGADVSAFNHEGSTPLHFAVDKDTSTITIRALLTAGADIEATDNKGRTPFHRCAMSGKRYETADAISLLLDAARQRGIDVNQYVNRTDLDGRNALHLACLQLSKKPLADLLRAGVNLSHPDNQGLLPFHSIGYAGRHGGKWGKFTSYFLTQWVEIHQSDILPFLLANVDSQGRTILHHACAAFPSGVREEIIEALLAGREIAFTETLLNAEDKTGKIAMHLLLEHMVAQAANDHYLDGCFTDYKSSLYLKMIAVLDTKCNSLLHRLAALGDLPCFEVLYSSVLSLPFPSDSRLSLFWAPNNAGETPLHIAIRAGQTAFALQFMRRFGNSTSIASFKAQLHSNGHSPLHLAIEMGDTGVVTALTRECLSFPEWAEIRNKAGQTPEEYLQILGESHYKTPEVFQTLTENMAALRRDLNITAMRKQEQKAKEKKIQNAYEKIFLDLPQLKNEFLALKKQINDLNGRCYKSAVIPHLTEIKSDLDILLFHLCCAQDYINQRTDVNLNKQLDESMAILNKIAMPACKEAIDQHRGAGIVLLNIAILLAGLILFSIIALAIKMKCTHATSFFINPEGPTTTRMKIEAVKT